MTKHVLIGCTGSVAAMKVPILVNSLIENIPEIEVQVVTTDNALHFFNKAELTVPVFTDADEWNSWSTKGDPVIHVELRRWADVLLIAPLDANTLGKMACGLCDNLLTCVVRAWDSEKPLLFATAMNTNMWNHPITAQQVETLKRFGYTEIPCVSKKLACGDHGLGGMASMPTLIEFVKESLKSRDQGSPSHNGTSTQ